MSEPVIKVENLGKKYIIGHQVEGGAIQGGFPTLRDRIIGSTTWLKNQAISKLTGKTIESPEYEEFWAVKDVSFEIQRGDRIGIIGRNGAGKSTLLKILSRITEPTTGQITLNGRVASLLEVGTGFHPELTGRENIYLNGAILGMSKIEIKSKFDEIVEFSEVEKFLDTPVKRYSSGMYVRLAFAVAAHLEPEILIIDEVLAVGDTQFQKKCLGKMDDVSKEGRTILFVSHNLLAVENLCNRAIFLNKGKMLDEGSPSQVISSYIQPFFSTTRERIWSKVSNAPGNEDVRLHKVSVRPLGSKLSDIITISTPFILEFEYWNFDTSTHLSVCLCLYNEQDILVFDICSPNDRDGTQYPLPTGLLRSTCCIPGNFLNNGLYRVSVKITHNHSVIIDQPEALTFSIADSDEQRDGWYGKWPGVLRPILDWEINIPIKANPDFESGSFSKGNDVV